MPKRLDLTGQTYGYLQVLEPTDQRDGSNVVWRCLCTACGRECYLSTRSLRSGGSRSCGCMRPSYLGDRLGKIVEQAGIGETNQARIRSTKPQKNNASGVRGVSRYNSSQWEATIYYKRRKMRLYLGPDFGAAVQARKAGEKWRLDQEAEKNNCP